MKRPQRGSRLRATGDMVMLEDPEDPGHFTPRPQYQEVLPAAFPYQRIGGWLLAGLVVVLILLGLVSLWTLVTGGVIHVSVTYPGGHPGRLIPSPPPLRTPPPGGG